MAIKKFLILFILITISLSGCSDTEDPQTDHAQESETYDFKEKGLVLEGSENESLLYLNECREYAFDDPSVLIKKEFDNIYFLKNSSNSNIYELSSVQDIGVTVIDAEDFLHGPASYIASFSKVSAEKWTLFVFDRNDQNILTHLYAVQIDHLGRFLEKFDVLPILLQNGICKEDSYGDLNAECDSAGNIYFYNSRDMMISMLNAGGEFIKSYVPADESSDGNLECIKTDQNELLFVSIGKSGTSFLYADGKNNEFIKLNSSGDLRSSKILGLQNSSLYYAYRSKLYQLDISNGTKTTLLDLSSYSLVWNYISLLSTGDNIKILSDEGEKKLFFTFSNSKIDKEDNLEILSFVNDEPGYLKNAAARFSIKNPSIGVSYHSAADSDAKTDRAFMDLMSDRGADILYVSSSDMKNLNRQGFLTGIEDFFDKENLDVVYPVIKKAGTIDDTLYGMPLYAEMGTLWITDQYWTKDTWDIEDIINIVKKNPDLFGIFYENKGYEENLRCFLGEDLMDSRFIQNNKADFNNEVFREILRLIKEKTPLNGPSRKGDTAHFDSVREGEYLGLYLYTGTLEQFCFHIQQLGPKSHIAGMPSSKGRQIPIHIEGFIVVNKNSEKKDAIGKFLNYLISADMQDRLYDAGTFNDLSSIRSDMSDRHIGEYEDLYVWYINNIKDFAYKKLARKEDGPLRADEYEKLWEDAIYIDNESSALFDIILEETDAYFYSDKDIDTVLESINNRVQLYLDERK